MGKCLLWEFLTKIKNPKHRKFLAILHDPWKTFERSVWERHNAKGSPKNPLVSLNLLSGEFMQGVSTHSSLLSVFGLNATSTYDSYLPLTFGNFTLIWGHFQNVSVCRFRGRWGPRGQTTSKSKTTKILNENLLKLDEIQNLASATSKMTSWPQRPRKWLSGFFQKIHF